MAGWYYYISTALNSTPQLHPSGLARNMVCSRPGYYSSLFEGLCGMHVQTLAKHKCEFPLSQIASCAGSGQLPKKSGKVRSSCKIWLLHTGLIRSLFGTPHVAHSLTSSGAAAAPSLLAGAAKLVDGHLRRQGHLAVSVLAVAVSVHNHRRIRKAGRTRRRGRLVPLEMQVERKLVVCLLLGLPLLLKARV